jgi:hypothetical protein
MFYIGIVDMVTLVCNGWLTGYFGIIGMMFCVSPKFNYFLSCYGLSQWPSPPLARANAIPPPQAVGSPSRWHK